MVYSYSASVASNTVSALLQLVSPPLVNLTDYVYTLVTIETLEFLHQ